jgi:RND family efflux transporter MFP subunit
MIHRLPLFAVAAALALCPCLVQAADESVRGTIEPFKKITVNSPVIQEIITDMKVKEGSEIKEGDIIVELRKEREELDVQLSEKLIELKRFIALGQQKLFKENMGVSQEKALEAQTDLQLAELQMSAKRVALREKTVHSPIGGTVVKVYKSKGESADRTEKLLDIINYDKVLAKFYLPPASRATVKVGQTVKVRVAEMDNAEVEGKIEFIDPRNDAASSKVLIHVLIENADHRISPGMNADYGK